MIKKELQRRIWLIANPTIGVDELSINLGIHTNTGYKILSDAKTNFKTKMFQRKQLLNEFLVTIKLSNNSSKNYFENYVIENDMLIMKYCTHQNTNCSCSYVIECDYGEIIIIGVDYLMNSHSLVIRVIITDPDVQKELIPIMNKLADGSITIETVIPTF